MDGGAAGFWAPWVGDRELGPPDYQYSCAGGNHRSVYCSERSVSEGKVCVWQWAFGAATWLLPRGPGRPVSFFLGCGVSKPTGTVTLLSSQVTRATNRQTSNVLAPSSSKQRFRGKLYMEFDIKYYFSIRRPRGKPTM